jgi:RluA family pseudouridine synthase
MAQRMDRLEILYEDEAILLINKPAGLLVIPDRWDPGKSTATRLAQDYLGAHAVAGASPPTDEARVWVVHRLDRETSGALVLAKSAHAYLALSQQFERGTVRKSYLALVIGRVPQEEGIISRPIGRHPSKPGLMAIRGRQGKPARTRYTVLERFRDFTLLGLQPETGRTHQIRVHLQAIGFPLAIDSLYGGGSALFLSAIKPSYKSRVYAAEYALMARLTLHAQVLQLAHPTHGGIIEVEAPLPKDFTAVLRNLRRFQRLPREPLPPPSNPRGKQERTEI